MEKNNEVRRREKKVRPNEERYGTLWEKWKRSAAEKEKKKYGIM